MVVFKRNSILLSSFGLSPLMMNSNFLGGRESDVQEGVWRVFAKAETDPGLLFWSPELCPSLAVIFLIVIFLRVWGGPLVVEKPAGMRQTRRVPSQLAKANRQAPVLWVLTKFPGKLCAGGGGEHAVKLTRKLGGTGWSPWKATSMAIAEFMGKPAGTPSKFPGSYPLSLPGNRLG